MFRVQCWPLEDSHKFGPFRRVGVRSRFEIFWISQKPRQQAMLAANISHCISHCTAEVAAGVFARLDPATVKQVVLIGWGTTEAATMFDSRSLWPMICLEACNQFAMG